MITQTQLINKTREKISQFCITSCDAQCCKSGFLLLMTEKEVNAIVGNKIIPYISDEILIPKIDYYLYDLKKQKCKNLRKDNGCKIHTNTNRPLICRDYPIIIQSKGIRIGRDCKAVKAGLTIELEKELKKLNVEITH